MECQLLPLIQTSVHLKHLNQIHSLILRKNLDLNQAFIKRLLNLLFVNYAHQVFLFIPQSSQHLCNSMLAYYSKSNLNKQAIETFSAMHHGETKPNCYSFPPVLKACAAQSAIRQGEQLHSLIITFGLDSNVFIQTGLVDLYAKCGMLDHAKRVFYGILVKDTVTYNCLISGYSKAGEILAARQLFDEMPDRTVVSWNSMISCYAHNGDLYEGLQMFERMRMEKVCPSEITLVTVLSICAKLGDLEMGLKVKEFIGDKKLHTNMILATAVLEMYVKCGSVDDAREVFDEMPKRDIVAWSAMIAGYAQNGRSIDALQLFDMMKMENLKPNDVTLVSVLSACAQLGSVELGESIGCYIEIRGLVSSIYVGSALVDMYSKCGNIKRARQVFDRMPRRDIVSWNSMIGGLAVNGFGKDAIDLFMEMKEAAVEPNDITFVGLLTACTHAGLIDLGCEFFEIMKDLKIAPKIEHCACMVDLFCRAGRLEDAYGFIEKMDLEPNVVIWGTLLSACRIHLNVELAERSVEKLLVLEPESSGNYVLLSNIYASVGRWDDALKMRGLMKEKRVQKIAAYSWIEVENMVHKFLVQDKSHPRCDEIYSVVDGLDLQLKSVGYAPDSSKSVS